MPTNNKAEQRHNEKVSMKTAEAQAKVRLQQERETVATSSHASPVITTPGQPGVQQATMEVPRRTEQQIIHESEKTTLSPVSEQSREQDRHDSFMVPAVTTPQPELAQETATASTNLSPQANNSLTPDSEIARQQDSAPSLNLSVQTIEGSDPQTPLEEGCEKEIFVPAGSSNGGRVNSLPVANPKMEEVNTVHVVAPKIQTSVK